MAAASLSSALIAACSNSLEPSPNEQWAADLTVTHQVLSVTFQRVATSLTGTGTLSSLLVPDDREALTLTGSRRADTLDLLLSGANGNQYHVKGYYVLNGEAITATLTGGAFSSVSIGFRKR